MDGDLRLPLPAGPCPPAPSWHVESDACRHGWVSLRDDGPAWLLCDCENPADPWPARLPTDGPRDCECAICYGRPRRDRGRIDGCEYRDHHCEGCHERRLCTEETCWFVVAAVPREEPAL